MKPPRTRKLPLLQGIRSGAFCSFLFFFLRPVLSAVSCSSSALKPGNEVSPTAASAESPLSDTPL